MRHLGWYGALLGLLVPILGLGLGLSAAANRLAFAGWGLAMTPLVTVALRRGFEAWRGVPGIVVRVAPVVAAGFAVLAWLVARHREITELGLRALLGANPGTALAADPQSYWVLAGLAALAWGTALLWPHRPTESPDRTSD
jgi:hypothetical protein